MQAIIFTPMSGFMTFCDALATQLQGDLYIDDLRRGIYATDASMYQILPLAVVCPKNEADVIATVTLAREHGIPLLPRGGGTSLAGQTVGHAVVLDFTKYMHQVLAYNPAAKQITVQPGISRGELNLLLKKDGLEFAPDPATSTRAAIGGMIANNSSGTKSVIYGKTSDHVLALKVLLSDGTIIETKNFSREEIKSLPDTREGNIWKQLHALVQQHQQEIASRYPKTMRRVGGYCLDELIHDAPWNPGRIFLGSEGTLAIILSATLNLVALPKCKGVAVIHFRDGIEAIRAVPLMLNFQPAAVEVLNDLLLEYSKKNLETQSMCGFIRGEPESIQMVEFYGDTTDEIRLRAEAMFTALKNGAFGYAYDYFPEGEMYRNVWGIRERGLGLLLGEPSESKGVEFIEDAAIPVEHLAEYISRVLQVCKKHDVDVTYYAHASVGVLHVRPILNLQKQDDIEKLRKIADEVFALVVEYKGSWSSEHGDGIIRSSYLREFYGDTIYGLFRQVKDLFDPTWIMNPGKILDPPEMLSNLRYGAAYRDQPVETVYHYRDQQNFHTAVHQCSGIGACRKMSGGTMCPSFMVTREETHTTRGRANALRLAMSGQFSKEGLSDPKLKEVMDLCVSCKACKAECPSSVDMARLKSEILQMHYQKHGSSRRDRMIRDSVPFAKRFSGRFAGIVNKVQGTSLFRNVLHRTIGFHRDRMLPAYASETFATWFSRHYVSFDGPPVVFFADTYVNYYEPSVGKSAVRLINYLGYDVILATGCCQRPRISHGFLELAKKKGIQTAQGLDSYLQNGIPVLVCEPSCASALTDDLPDLFSDEMIGNRMKAGIQPIEKWIAAKLKERGTQGLKARGTEFLLHGHCHQKALFGTKDVREILQACGGSVHEVDSGCCGMAGSFGYEKEHVEISEKMARRVLIPAIEAAPHAQVIASGFSCRHQIAHFSGRKPVHWLEAIEVL